MSVKKGLLALSPLAVFISVYLASSLIAKDFYKIPVASAFLVASIYALCITRTGCRDGKSARTFGEALSERLSIFSKGASERNVLTMIWIFVMAGAFAATAKEIGAVEATVNLTLRLLPGKFVFAGLFLAACLISMAMGTSVGTVVALVPLAVGIAEQTGTGVAFITAIVTGGAFFGDNLSFISDTTIAATRTQACPMDEKFKANIRIAGPAALIVTVIYVIMGFNTDVTTTAEAARPMLTIPYFLIIVLGICGTDVMAVLAIGLVFNLFTGIISGNMGWLSFLSSSGEGIAGMGELIIVTLLAGGMLELIRYNGGLEFIT